jgi:hypothetical protein
MAAGQVRYDKGNYLPASISAPLLLTHTHKRLQVKFSTRARIHRVYVDIEQIVTRQQIHVTIFILSKNINMLIEIIQT